MFMREVKEVKVTTIFGNTVNKKDCISINGEYYQKNIDCFNIDGRWYRKGNPRIYFNDVKKQWMKKNQNVLQGIIDYSENGGYIFGNFEKSFEDDYKIHTQYGSYIVCSEKIFNSIPKVFDKYNGAFYDLNFAYNCRFDKSKDKEGNAYIYSFDRLYNSENLIEEFSQVNNSKYTENLLKVQRVEDVINKYSFGFEIETSAGILPEYKCKQLGLIPLRDGSINGHEYTTIPMKGIDGINLLANQMKELKNNCLINKECSVHLHLGGYPLEKSKILSLYNLCYSLQNEIGELFPYYIYNSGKYKSNGKDYCKKLPQKMDSIEMLYNFLSDGNADWMGSFTQPHPNDPRRDRKWEVHSRYYYCNFINMLFGEKVKTIEFRVHNATTNFDKLVNWLYICMAILNYAENGTPKNSIKLKDVIEFSYGDNTTKILMDYIAERKEYNKNCQNKYGDTYGYFDLMNDKEMSFKTPVN